MNTETQTPAIEETADTFVATLTLPRTLVLAMRDADDFIFDLESIYHANAVNLANVVGTGVSETVRNSYSSALADACPDSVTKGKKGDALTAARKAWGEANPDAVHAQRIAMAQAIVAKLNAGEQIIKAGVSAQPQFSDIEEATYVEAVAIKDRLPTVAKAYAACKGMVTAARKATVLAAVAGLPDGPRVLIARNAERKVAMDAELTAALSGETTEPAAS